MSIIFVNIITPPYLELTTKGTHSSIVNSVPAIPHHMPWASGGLGCVYTHTASFSIILINYYAFTVVIGVMFNHSSRAQKVLI